MQRQVRRPDGPVNVIENIIKLVENLEARISDISIEKEGRIGVLLKSPTLVYNYFKLMKQIDSLKLNDLLLPINSIMHSVQNVFDKTLYIRSSVGTLGTYVISDEQASVMRNLVSIIGVIKKKFNDVIVYGKRKLGTPTTQYDLFKHLYVYRENLSSLKEALYSLGDLIPPLMSAFSTHLYTIVQAVNPIILTARNFRSILKKALAERRKHTRTGIVGPRIVYQEVRNIVSNMREHMRVIINNGGDALASITEVVKIAINKIVEKTKEYIDFDVLNSRAYEAAVAIPPQADVLVRDVGILQSVFPY